MPVASRSFFRQVSQIANSDTYNGTLAAGTTLATNATTIEDDLNALRSQVARILDATGATVWTNDIATVDAKKRSLLQLNTATDTIEVKPALTLTQSLANIAVPAGQNYVILSASGSQTPSAPLAIGTSTIGAVVAQSTQNGSAFAANELTTQAGMNALNPKNLCQVHLASNGQSIEVSPQIDIFALVQVESTATDGGTANDTSGGNRVKLSFVTRNNSSGTLVACPASAIAGQTIQYTYLQRYQFSNFPEQAFVGTTSFIDNVSTVDITLTNAVLNQAGVPVPVNNNVTWQLGASNLMQYQNAAGSQTYWSLNGAGAMTFNVASLAVQSTAVPTFNTGLTVATGTTSVNVGVTAGQVDAAALKINSTGTNPLQLSAGAAIQFTDGYIGSSTYGSAAMKLAASTAEVNQFVTDFGAGVSILGALHLATISSSVAQAFGQVNVTVPAGTNVTGAGSTPNLTTQMPAYGSDFVGQVQVYINGALQVPGANSSASCDVYPGTNIATGDLIFNKDLRYNANHADQVAVITRKTGTNT